MYALLILISVLAYSSARHNHFYRKDYTYFEEFDAFYKLHWDNDRVSWNTAFITCDDEGSQLFYPKEQGEWVVVKKLYEELTDGPNVTDVIIGIRDEIGQGEFVTVDGESSLKPIELQSTEGQNCVIMDLETGAYSPDTCPNDDLTHRVFACKKIDEKRCPTIDLGYQYKKEAKKCYKVNNRKKTWQQAWHTCYMEGGLLVSPESTTEHDVLRSIITKDYDYFIGFRKIFKGSDFYTVKGQKLEDSGFPIWFHTNYEEIFDCGVVYYSNNYGTVNVKSKNCQDALPFICEMAAKV